MSRIFTLLLFFFGLHFLSADVIAQVNPSVAILPMNPNGVVNMGNTMDVKVTINNTLSGSIPAAKLRPIITIPAIATILPSAQQTGLPPGWTIVSNAGTQIRVCNGADIIGGNEQRDIIIKVQGSSVGGPTQCQVQMNFGGASCATTGPQPNGNLTVDDFATSSITVAAGCPLAINATAGTILCNGGNTNITVVSTGATGPVEYSISGGASFQPGNVFNNIAAGTYQVVTREINNPLTCVSSTTLTVTEPAVVPAPVVIITQPTCTVATGVVSMSSVAPDLIFSVDGGAYAGYPTGGYALATGTHTIIAKNSNDCISATTNIVINAQPLTPSSPIVGSITQPDCTVSTGSVTLNNLPAGSWTIQPGNITGNSSTALINNLAAGNYTFTVTNDQGCVSAASSNVNIIAVAGAPEAPLIAAAQPTCTIATGSIQINSATTGLHFSLDGAAFAAYPSGGYTGLLTGIHTLIAQNASGCSSPVATIIIDVQPASPAAPTVLVQQPTCTISTGIITVTSSTTAVSFSLDGGSFNPYPSGGYTVTAGTHSLAIQNSSGCAPNVSNNIIVNAQPASPLVTTSFTNITCFGSTSVITATATGAVEPYEFSLNAGPFQSDNNFTVAAGTYSLSAKDANGCVGTSGTIIISQPTAITATASASPVACNGGNSTITVIPSGGTGVYEYSLNNNLYQSSNTFSVPAGVYTVYTRSVNNPSCFAVSNISVNITEPAVLEILVKANAIAECGGKSTVAVTASGGTAPYTGIGSFEKAPGTWSFTVTDSMGCTASTEVMILPPGCVEIEVFPNPAQHFVRVNHSAAVQGASILLYTTTGSRVLSKAVVLNSFISTIDISKLASDMYILVFTNGKERKYAKLVKTNQ